MSHKLRQNIIIYGSLILAVILLACVAKEFYDNKGSEEPVLKELEEILGNKSKDEEKKNKKIEKEPSSIKDVDKASVINKYLDDILNRRINDDVLTYDSLVTWGDYEIIDIVFIKSITDSYYAYDVNIKIPNKDAIVVGKKDDKLYDGDYIVVEIEFDLLISEDEVIVKNVNA